MKKKNVIVWGIIFNILILSLLILNLVVAEPVSRGVAGGIPSGTTSTALPQQPLSCSNPQQCKEIDELWQIIGTSVRGSSEVWDVSTTTFGWRAFTTVYGPAAISVPPVISPVGREIKQKIVSATLDEYAFWNERNLKETDVEGKTRVESFYFEQGASSPLTANYAWSAAFISYVMKKAHVSDFPFSTTHFFYFRSIKKGNSPSCKTFPITSINSIESGDILCSCRDDGCPIDYNQFPEDTKESHCDIVVQRNGEKLEIIGGNVDDTVKKRILSIDTIRQNSHYFGFISCGDTSKMVSSSLQFQDTTHLPALIAESQRQGIDTCFSQVVVSRESGGKSDTIGFDANVPGCVIKARRVLLMDKSSNCKSQYQTQEDLKTDCLAHPDSAFDRYDKPLSGVNACLDDFLNTQQYSLAGLTKENFCNNRFDAGFSYGIGLGQITPSAGTTEITIDGTKYTHCDLFNPQNNIKATVSLLKQKGANINQDKAQIQEVYRQYAGALTPGVERRVEDHLRCRSEQLLS